VPTLVMENRNDPLTDLEFAQRYVTGQVESGQWWAG